MKKVLLSLTALLLFDGCRPNCLQIILHGLNQVSYYYICADNPDLALVCKFVSDYVFLITC